MWWTAWFMNTPPSCAHVPRHGFGVVVRLVARPPQPDRAHHQPAEASLLERLPRLHDRQVVAVLVDDEQLHAVRVARLDHAVRILEPQRQRLLDDERPAVLDQVEHVLAVQRRLASAR